jgi:hypothetical protein
MEDQVIALQRTFIRDEGVIGCVTHTSRSIAVILRYVQCCTCSKKKSNVMLALFLLSASSDEKHDRYAAH